MCQGSPILKTLLFHKKILLNYRLQGILQYDKVRFITTEVVIPLLQYMCCLNLISGLVAAVALIPLPQRSPVTASSTGSGCLIEEEGECQNFSVIFGPFKTMHTLLYCKTPQSQLYLEHFG